jgi:hypothetical protein
MSEKTSLTRSIKKPHQKQHPKNLSPPDNHKSSTTKSKLALTLHHKEPEKTNKKKTTWMCSIWHALHPFFKERASLWAFLNNSSVASMTLINCQGIAFEPYQIKRDLTEKNIKNYLLLLFEERAKYPWSFLSLVGQDQVGNWSAFQERNIEPRNKATDADTPKQQEKMGLHHHKKHNNSKEHYCPSVAAFFVTIVKRASWIFLSRVLIKINQVKVTVVSLSTTSSTFDSLFRVLFTFPSQYFCAIGLPAIFSFGWDLPPFEAALSSNPTLR